MSLRERARLAWEIEREARKVERQREMEARRDALYMRCLTMFRVPPTRVALTDDWDEVVLDDIRLAAMEGEGDQWFELLGRCPRCGELCPNGNPISTLADLGRALSQGFIPDEHKCTALERLGDHIEGEDRGQVTG